MGNNGGCGPKMRVFTEGRMCVHRSGVGVGMRGNAEADGVDFAREFELFVV